VSIEQMAKQEEATEKERRKRKLEEKKQAQTAENET